MKVDETVWAPNALLLITTSAAPDIPTDFAPDLFVQAASSCALVAVAHEAEAPVRVVLSDDDRDRPSAGDGLEVGWSGVLENRDGYVALESVMGDRWVELPCVSERVLIEVWASDFDQPESIWVTFRSEI